MIGQSVTQRFLAKTRLVQLNAGRSDHCVRIRADRRRSPAAAQPRGHPHRGYPRPVLPLRYIQDQLSQEVEGIAAAARLVGVSMPRQDLVAAENAVLLSQGV